MFNIGQFVTFFSINEDFDHINLNKDIEPWIDSLGWYEVKDLGDTWLDVKNQTSDRITHVNSVYDEYQVFTKEGLRQHLKTLNHKHKAVCNKIIQLYRKHNESNSSFKFKGV